MYFTCTEELPASLIRSYFSRSFHASIARTNGSSEEGMKKESASPSSLLPEKARARTAIGLGKFQAPVERFNVVSDNIAYVHQIFYFNYHALTED